MRGMTPKKPLPLPEDEAEDLGPASIYDGDPSEEDDLWFLPPDEDVADDDFFLPGPRPEQRLLFDPRDWRAAQSELSAELADLTLTFWGAGRTAAGRSRRVDSPLGIDGDIRSGVVDGRPDQR